MCGVFFHPRGNAAEILGIGKASDFPRDKDRGAMGSRGVGIGRP